jgi:Zn-dependent protease
LKEHWMFNLDFWRSLLLPLPWIILGLSFHEFCHAWMSNRLGDPLPERQGRLTLNPLKHIDPIGLLTIIIFRFGWARPVEINPRFYRNPLRDTVWVSLAGPVGNFILAVIFAFIVRFMPFFNISDQLTNYMGIGLYYSLMLGFFNLLPIPPLDGSKILRYFLKGSAGYQFDKLEPYGFFVLIILLIIPGFQRLLFNGIYILTVLLGGRMIIF